MNVSFAVGFDDESLRLQALALAQQFNVPLDNQMLPRLCVTQDKLILLAEGYAPLFADFTAKTIVRRQQAGKAQGLIRACKPKDGLCILDATAGWGRDSAILASFGAEVIMLERQPIMFALLTDALTRLSQQASTSLNLSLIHIDAMTYLQHLSVAEYPDVIYIDPMHPVRQKSALVKKDMQVLQQLIGADDDVACLLQQAQLVARERVVLKWPQRLAPIGTPNYSIQGKTVRFDVYQSLREN